MSDSCRGDIVSLNVGGRPFVTARTTLFSRRDPDCALNKMFDQDSGMEPARRDPATGAYFVDRNPDAFAVILEYLRSGESVVHLAGGVSAEQIRAEADYFGLEGLLRQLNSVQIEVIIVKSLGDARGTFMAWALSNEVDEGEEIVIAMEDLLPTDKQANRINYHYTNDGSHTGILRTSLGKVACRFLNDRWELSLNSKDFPTGRAVLFHDMRMPPPTERSAPKPYGAYRHDVALESQITRNWRQFFSSAKLITPEAEKRLSP